MEQKHGDQGSRQASNSACAQSGMRHSRSLHEMRVLHHDGEREDVGSGHSILDAAAASWVLGARGWGKAGTLVEETRALQEQGWKRRSIRARHYVYVSPDGKTFTTMADALKYGKIDARKGDGEEVASGGGGEKRRHREQAAVDSLKNYEGDDASPTVVNAGDSASRPLRIKRMATVLQDVSEKEDAEDDDDAAGGGEAVAEGTVFRHTARRPQTHSETAAGGGGSQQEQVCKADDNARTHSAYGDAQLAAAAAAEYCATSSSCRCKADGSAAQTGQAADAEEVVGRRLQVFWSRYR